MIAYNEIDPYAVEYLRRLQLADLIAPGHIFTCSIEDLTPRDLAPYTQFHAFAGMGVWSYALRRAGWPDDRPVWSASCPCQPFSEAGQGAGFADERHLWPAYHHLVAACRPQRVVGEQVSDKGGAAWIDLVSSDMEAAGYAFRAVGLCSAGFGGSDRRHRNYWDACDLANPYNGQRLRGSEHGEHEPDRAPRRWVQGHGELAGDSHAGRVGDTDDARRKRLAHGSEPIHEPQRPAAQRTGGEPSGDGRPGPVNGFWGNADWILCRDPGGPRWRPVEPGTFPLVNGAPARLGRLRAIGNAINAQVAQAFIEELDTP